jgi:wyosine [tRNA(Phe)-imidazoG37] synthetase (radical SAM superfamily)
MKYLFGPVQSRRLGLSLGIDLVPYKTCTLDCVYCECGKTTCLTSEIKEYVPTGEVIDELKEFLAGSPTLDVLTFSGSGEPTLHSGIGTVIDFLKDNYPNYRVAVLTNGTLFWHEEVRKRVSRADVIIPSLDAAVSETFSRIGRPVTPVTMEKTIDGLTNLRSEYNGTLVLEVFIIPGVNTSEEELLRLRETLLQVDPDVIQLNRLDRPGTEEWVDLADDTVMNMVADFLKPMRVQTVGKPVYQARSTPDSEKLEESVRAVLSRRPSTMEDLSATLGIRRSQLSKILHLLREKGLVEEYKMERGWFYRLKQEETS